MDNLEKFIKENRQQLDVYKPEKKVWKSIRSATAKKRTLSLNSFMKAAMILLMLGTGYILLRTGNGKIYNGKNGSDNVGGYSENALLYETELYYGNLINDLYKKASPFLTVNPEIESELKSDFSGLDSLCNDIKADLKDNVANQEVIEALILNYRAKIQILEDMLLILDENDTTKNTGNYEL